MLMDDPLMKRNRTFSPLWNRPVQLAAGVIPFIRYVYACPETSARSVSLIRISPHMRLSATVARQPFVRASLMKSPTVRLLKLK